MKAPIALGLLFVAGVLIWIGFTNRYQALWSALKNG